MVGGNHEDAPAMRAFREAGIVQLADGPVELAGLTLTGFDDPLAGGFAALTDIAVRRAAAEEALKVIQAEVPTPDVAVFHDVGQAERSSLGARPGVAAHRDARPRPRRQCREGGERRDPRSRQRRGVGVRAARPRSGDAVRVPARRVHHRGGDAAVRGRDAAL